MTDPTPAPSTITTSYARDIRPLFTDLDIQKMAWAFDLAAYGDVKANASKILDRIQGIGGAVMPPPAPRGDGPWSSTRVDLFKKWAAEGCPP